MADKIKLTILGTSSAVPTKYRNHPAMLINYKDENILIDCGEGTQRQFRKADLNPCKLTRILITHWHGDHVFGLPGLFQTLALNDCNKEIQIYGPSGTKNFMDLYKRLFIQREQLKIKVNEINEKEIKKPIIETNDFVVHAQKMIHDAPTLAYSFEIKQRTRLDKEKLLKLKLGNSPLIGELKKGKTIKISGKTINPKSLTYSEPSKKITIIMDTKQNPNTIKIAKDSDILICESTYDNSEEGKECAEKYSHLTSAQAAEIAKKSNSKKLILTHLSQKYSTKQSSKELLDNAKKIFKNTSIAEDFDFLEI